jgi:hypothetical protein
VTLLVWRRSSITIGGRREVSQVQPSTTRRSTFWLVAAVLFTLVNLGGLPFAAVQGEWLHAGVHMVLTLVGAYYVRRIWRDGRSETPALTADYTARLTNIEQSLDAVAVEVERIGEGQRFMTRVLTEKPNPQKQPIEIKPPKQE